VELVKPTAKICSGKFRDVAVVPTLVGIEIKYKLVTKILSKNQI
jgi:hypothetical protein